MKRQIPVGRPNIGDRQRLFERINLLLDSRVLTNNGPLVREFEMRIAEFTGATHAVACSNATVALEIAAKSLGLEGEVIVPAFTFVATCHALSWLGIKPVFADIEAGTHNIDPYSVERAITARTTAILGVHLWGRPCRTDLLDKIAKRHDLSLMYDAAHAFGCSHQGTMIGNFGACEVFSFHATKFLNSFEGGAIVTNDADLAAKCRLVRNFGFEGTDKVVSVGINAKMPEVCAAMGLTSLDAIDEIVATNRSNYAAYREALSYLRGIRLVEYDEAEMNNYQYIVIEVDQKECGHSRDEIVEKLRLQGVMARRYFWPGCHNFAPYVSRDRAEQSQLPNTDFVASRVVVLPTGQAIDKDDIDSITATIADCLTSRRSAAN